MPYLALTKGLLSPPVLLLPASLSALTAFPFIFTSQQAFLDVLMSTSSKNKGMRVILKMWPTDGWTEGLRDKITEVRKAVVYRGILHILKQMGLTHHYFRSIFFLPLLPFTFHLRREHFYYWPLPSLPPIDCHICRICYAYLGFCSCFYIKLQRIYDRLQTSNFSTLQFKVWDSVAKKSSRQ